jgi:hypothetical protein
MFLWAAVSAAAGSEGAGLMRIEARADGLDPAGWTRFSKGWRGGSCEDFDITGTLAVAGSNRAGVLTLDLAAPDAAWSAAPLDSGLPINNERSALLPVTAVAALPDTPPTIVAGSERGVFIADENGRYRPGGLTTFADAVPLPRNWLYCSGEHRLEVITEAEAAGS